MNPENMVGKQLAIIIKDPATGKERVIALTGEITEAHAKEITTSDSREITVTLKPINQPAYDLNYRYEFVGEGRGGEYEQSLS